MSPQGSPARQSSGAFQPAAHGLSVIKGCGEQEKTEKLLKLYLAS